MSEWRLRQWEVPLQAITDQSLLDNLVSAGEQDRRHLEAERLSRLEVNHKLIPRRRLHRQVGRLLAVEDTIDITGREPIWLAGSIKPGRKLLCASRQNCPANVRRGSKADAGGTPGLGPLPLRKRTQREPPRQLRATS